MQWTEVVISLALIVLVLRQIHGRPLGWGSLVWPLGLVLWGAVNYLSVVPPYGEDMLFVATLGCLGLGLGLGCGCLTTVYLRGSTVMARAQASAAALWIVGMSSRLIFGIFAVHGGAGAIAQASTELNLHSESTWPTALVTMALCEVSSRTLILALKRRRLVGDHARAQ